MISIVDYGLGNLKAFVNIYKQLNIDIQIASTAKQLNLSDKIILPGVGSFDHAMEKLSKSGLRDKLEELVWTNSIPVLGICVGMQILGLKSDEGELEGLGWIDGKVKKFDSTLIKEKPKLPHMGWNNVQPIIKNNLFNNIGKDPIFYFLHSYYFSLKSQEYALATSNYGIDFTCAINDGNIFGVQFHPEKSHHYGVQLLKNFALI